VTEEITRTDDRGPGEDGAAGLHTLHTHMPSMAEKPLHQLAGGRWPPISLAASRARAVMALARRDTAGRRLVTG
jgi:hypothetical protein